MHISHPAFEALWSDIYYDAQDMAIAACAKLALWNEHRKVEMGLRGLGAGLGMTAPQPDGFRISTHIAFYSSRHSSSLSPSSIASSAPTTNSSHVFQISKDAANENQCSK